MRRGAGLAAGLALAVGLLVAAEKGLEWARRWLAPTGGAAWIWAPGAEPGAGATAFYAVRDFDLAEWPVSARIRVGADEEYQLLVNGDLVGCAGRTSAGRLAAYEVGPLLLPGANRIVAEVRSGRGAGAFVLDLEIDGDPPRRVGSDGRWKILRRFERALLDPDRPLAEGAVPHVWPPPPAGRWPAARPARPRPLFRDLLSAPAPVLPRRARAPGDPGWTAIERVDWRSPSLGPRVTFDFGRELTAYLGLVFAETRPAKALLWTGPKPPRAGLEPVAGYALKLDGTRSWTASEPRSFRYVTVWSLAALVGARAFEVEAGRAADRTAPGGRPAGVFGLAPPPLPSPAEDEIRRELEGLAGDAAGQGL